MSFMEQMKTCHGVGPVIRFSVSRHHCHTISSSYSEEIQLQLAHVPGSQEGSSGGDISSRVTRDEAERLGQVGENQILRLRVCSQHPILCLIIKGGALIQWWS